LFLKLQTYLRLGLTNILRAAVYRLGVRIGLHPAVWVKARIGGDQFFTQPLQIDKSLRPSGEWNGDALYFGWYRLSLQESIPAWHVNPFNGKAIDSPRLPWWKLPDFNLNVGDIKTIWEASRFDWVLAFAQRAKTGDLFAIDRLNAWLYDWCKANPAYCGPNWKCGQEASIRIMHLAVAAKMLDQQSMPPDLIRLIEAHLARIYPTRSYAIAQDNNHGTSEAAALFMGGSWCASHGVSQGKRWARAGRRLLEDRAKRLIAADGSFSQYSINYHRVLIDTLCMAEIWRRWRRLDEFSPLFYQRASAAAKWLFAFVSPCSGDAPNIGGNDGARLLPLADTGLREFRPSVQLAMALFAGQRAYAEGDAVGLPLRWLGVSLPDAHAAMSGSQQFDKGGFGVLRRDDWMAVLRYPRYRFRPRHCDALHVDLWRGGENLLRDGGSFSYNAGTRWLAYFTGAAGHNTIEFDGRDQMPHLGRFLRGAWLEGRDVQFGEDSEGVVSAAAGYCDWKRASHHRSISLYPNGLVIRDAVKGFLHRAVLRWRLQPGDWRLEGNTAVWKDFNLHVSADVPIVRLELLEGWESRQYFRKTVLPVLEAEVQVPGKITTEFFSRK